MISSRMTISLVILVSVFSAILVGCGGSGGGDSSSSIIPPPPPPPVDRTIQVQPQQYDFGVVTPGNQTAPLEVDITNTGTDPLQISSFALSNTTDFTLDANGGSNPCGSGGNTLASGEACTLTVSFLPQANSSFAETLTIASNASNTPTYQLQLAAKQEPVTALNVQINQVEACPRPIITAYVSVTDQANFPVTQLTTSDFSVIEATTTINGAPSSTAFVENIAPLSVTLVMDYSGSISGMPDIVKDMENSASTFIDQLGVADEAEVIKFADSFDVVQSFLPGTAAGKDALKTAITAPYSNGINTRLYDAIYKAVQDTAPRTNPRRAVIVLSDGMYDSSQTTTLATLLAEAQADGVPVFPVGMGTINESVLQQLADGTSGQIYQSPTSDNLLTIYHQLSDLLLFDQYILTYSSSLATGATADLKIDANLNGLLGENIKVLPTCP